MKCKRCYSCDINHLCHGRDGSDQDLCDVCYWRQRAEVRQGQTVTLDRLVRFLEAGRTAKPWIKGYENMLASSLSSDSRSHDGDRQPRRDINTLLNALTECDKANVPDQATAPMAAPPTDLFGDWIPCKDRLPADQIPVLVVSAHGKRVVMYRERGVWVENLTTARWEPTHWAPLPPSPNVKSACTDPSENTL